MAKVWIERNQQKCRSIMCMLSYWFYWMKTQANIDPLISTYLFKIFLQFLVQSLVKWRRLPIPEMASSEMFLQASSTANRGGFRWICPVALRTSTGLKKGFRLETVYYSLCHFDTIKIDHNIFRLVVQIFFSHHRSHRWYRNREWGSR